MSKMDIRLQSLSLKNFKGIKEFILDIGGQNANVYGENAAGKTTLYDAFLWLLFDKDSTNRKDFSVKTHDKDGNEIHGLEHEVEAILTVDSKPLRLKKMLTEKWTKKHGEAEKIFTGHETAYWVDEVPVKKNEYTSRINQLIDEGEFKLLTNPLYFNQQLKWEERRKILLTISGNITDEQVISSNTKLSKLAAILGDKSTDDYKKIINERTKKVNEEIGKIPVRIDELMATLAGENVDYTAAEASLMHFKNQLAVVETELAGAGNAANAYRQKQQQFFKLQTEIETLKKALDEQANAGFKRVIDEKTALLNEKYRLEQESGSLGSRLENLTQNITDMAKEIVALREQWQSENMKTFAEPDMDNFVCPACKRTLPEDDIEQKIADMRANHDTSKVDELARISERGKTLKTKKEGVESEAGVLNQKLFEMQAKLQEINDRLTEIEKDLSQGGQVQADYESDTKYCQLQADIKVLEAELDKPIEDVSTPLLERKADFTRQIEDINRALNNRDVAEKTRARIEELKVEERQLAQQLSELEEQKYLIEQFIKTKVGLLEGGINSRFSMVKFKLFDIQINGGVVECCETMVCGVPFQDANHAGQINGGIDIINTLSDYYGASCPIWIDNAEAVNELIPANGQVIRLLVSKDKKLKVEV